MVDKAMTCELCKQRGTTHNSLNRHHVQGRKKGQQLPLMRVHGKTCHYFAEWVTSLYIEAGREEELFPKHIIYLYGRFASGRRSSVFDLPL